ncbi:hypothetical protein SAMN04488543_1347 [Friedmanniella luteola]|uniref:Uncharacterized protein n=1 Tax=Friedmanniella luteola TaxID=546871 RepID=A0A1H1QKL5_9ACTN|nr:hypothetical protein [Friedmanniella luteola]SDS24022.1 hypothetical protein SAMN04488543_1347 [Friedmanniella luteola]
MTSTLPAPAVVTEHPPPARRPLFVALLVLFRVLTTAHLGLALVQPISIGQYLDGRYGLLRLHQTAAGLLVLTALVLALVGVGYVLAGGRLWALGCPLLFLLAGVQTGLGYNRALGVHIPLGVALVALAVAVAVLSWAPAAARPRAPRRTHRTAAGDGAVA